VEEEAGAILLLFLPPMGGVRRARAAKDSRAGEEDSSFDLPSSSSLSSARERGRGEVVRQEVGRKEGER